MFRVQFCSRLQIISGVTLHSSKVLPSLGEKSMEILSRFRERASATLLEKALIDALQTVGLDLRDISGITTDGASVMKKLGRLLTEKVHPQPFYHQLCMAHGLHLAVLDAFKVEVADITSSSNEEAATSETCNWLIAGISGPLEDSDTELEGEIFSS